MSVNAQSASSGYRPASFPLEPSLVLPTELYETLNYVYFLHSLAVTPDSVLPPGKSLLSVLSRPYTHDHASKNSDLHKRVETIVHKAFWDEALELIGSPDPSVQLPRLKQLLADIREAVLPLLPEKHPVLVTLSLPLPPTSNLVRAVLGPLQDTLRALGTRCAPVHDQQLEDLLRALEDPPDTGLPKTIIDVTRSMLQLCDQMKEDLSQFVLGTMGEEELQEAVVREAAMREREFVLQLWGTTRVHELWDHWIQDIPRAPSTQSSASEQTSPRSRFVRRLIYALSTNHAVSCKLPAITVPADTGADASGTPPPAPVNSLPPPLLFVTPTLLYLQNYLQALVIAASLRALVRIPSSQTTNNGISKDDLPDRPFEERVWLLLKADIDGEPSGDGAKIINLADEVVRVSRLGKDGLDSAEEARLRTAVDRTLKPNDPVFMLLQNRLMNAIQARLSKTPRAPEGPQTPSVPKYLQSGRRGPGVTRPLKAKYSDVKVPQNEQDSAKLIVNGYDHPIFVAAVSQAVTMLQGCINWIEGMWEDLLLPDSHT